MSVYIYGSLPQIVTWIFHNYIIFPLNRIWFSDTNATMFQHIIINTKNQIFHFKQKQKLHLVGYLTQGWTKVEFIVGGGVAILKYYTWAIHPPKVGYKREKGF